MRIEKMIPNIRSFDCYIYSPYHYQRKFKERSMEDMDTDVVAEQWIQLVIICQQVLIGYGYFNGNKVLYMITYIWSEEEHSFFSPLRVSKALFNNILTIFNNILQVKKKLSKKICQKLKKVIMGKYCVVFCTVWLYIKGMISLIFFPSMLFLE